LAVADGALGFWAALRDVYPETEEQRCWVHKLANVLDKLPQRLQPRAKSHLHEIMRAPNRVTTHEELTRFQEEYEAKYPKAVACLTQDADRLFTFMDYPAAHWLHLRTTNAIESTFATVKARTRITKGAGSRDAGVAMAFKLLTQAEKRWRRVNAAHLVALVHAGVMFPDGQTRLLPDMLAEVDVGLPVDAASESTVHNI
jgi:transposase-like protein